MGLGEKFGNTGRRVAHRYEEQHAQPPPPTSPVNNAPCLRLRNVTPLCADAHSFGGPADVVVALHGCGGLTDAALWFSEALGAMQSAITTTGMLRNCTLSGLGLLVIGVLLPMAMGGWGFAPPSSFNGFVCAY